MLVIFVLLVLPVAGMQLADAYTLRKRKKSAAHCRELDRERFARLLERQKDGKR